MLCSTLRLLSSATVPSALATSLLNLLSLPEGSTIPLGDVGHAGSHRVLHNFNRFHRPWEASCVEVRNSPARDRRDEEKQQRVRALLDLGTSARGSHRKLDIPSQPLEHRSPNCASGNAPDGNGDDGTEVVFYFETSTAEGLRGFQQIGAQVSEGRLPGECRNATGQGGFATWTIPRRTFKRLLLELPP